MISTVMRAPFFMPRSGLDARAWGLAKSMIVDGTMVIMNDNDKRPRIVVSDGEQSPPAAPRSGTRDDVVMIDSFKPGRAFIVSAMWGIVMAVVVFLVCLAVVLGASKIGVLGSVNALLGKAMQLTVPMLVKMSGLFSIVLGVAICIVSWFKMMIYNSISFLVGGLEMKTLTMTSQVGGDVE